MGGMDTAADGMGTGITRTARGGIQDEGIIGAVEEGKRRGGEGNRG